MKLDPAVLTLIYRNYVHVPQKDCVVLGSFLIPHSYLSHNMSNSVLIVYDELRSVLLSWL